MGAIRIKTIPNTTSKEREIDIYPNIGLVTVFVFDFTKVNSIQRLITQVLDIMWDISNSRNQKIRKRDFPIWVGSSTNDLGMQLFSISLPNTISVRVFSLFYDKLGKEDSYLEIGSYYLRDTCGEPLFRYYFGKTILYEETLNKLGCNIHEGLRRSKNIESRSYAKEAERKPKSSPYAKAEKPKNRASKLHSMDKWEENRIAILDFIESLKAPCGYNQLRDIVMNSFGIDVYEENSSSFYKYGCIKLGWLFNSESLETPVRILINDSIDNKLKYIILAHELAHYVLHFPLLFMQQYVEEVSWEIPEMELYFNLLIKGCSPNFMTDIEFDANQFCSYFLLPPWMSPISKISGVIMEAGSSPSVEELVWRFLQPLFPDRCFTEYSWINWNEMKKLAGKETARLYGTNNLDEKTIYERILYATLRREESNDISRLVENKLLKVWEELQSVIGVALETDDQDAREYLKQLIEKMGYDYGEESIKSFKENQGVREIFPPVGFDIMKEKKVFPTIPLIPAIYNLEGNGDWKYLKKGRSSPAGTIEEWLAFQEGYGLVLYRYEKWQKEQLKKMGGF